jgi:hypothetical protein
VYIASSTGAVRAPLLPLFPLLSMVMVLITPVPVAATVPAPPAL